MKRNILKYTLTCFGLVCVSALFCTSCTGGFMDINTNPYQPTDNDMHGDNYDVGGFISQMEQNVVPIQNNCFQLSQNLIGDVYSGYMATPDNFNDNKDNTTYYFRDGWANIPLDSWYPNLLGAWINVRRKIAVRTNNNVESSDMYQMAQIIKIAGMSRITDIWGPMAYSKAGAGGLNAPYDKQSDIYKSFFKELDKAVEVLNAYIAKNPDKKPLQRFDMIYDGDYKQWVKFANSLHLRLAMRIVYADPELARKEAEKAVTAKGGLIDSKADDAILKSSHGTTLVNPLDFMANNYKDIVAGASIVSIMKGYDDPRLASYFTKSSYKGIDYVGFRTGLNLSTKKDDGLNCSNIKVEASTPLAWMKASEIQFLKAEGALRNWNMGETASAGYEQGIRLAFDEAGASGVDAYLANTGVQQNYVAPYDSLGVNDDTPAVNKLTVKWNDGASFNEKLGRIITQKWIAGFPDGMEAWAEFRRTGYPRLFPVKVQYGSVTVDNLPYQQIARYPFAPREYDLNATNINEAVQLLRQESSSTGATGDNAITKVWWDKNPNKDK